MTRAIVTWPDARLKRKSEAVVDFDANLHSLLDDMYDTMIASNGVGLAAIQIGVAIQALVINLPNEEGEQDKADLIEVINPKIIEKSGEIVWQEGCLSVPDFYEDVVRFDHVVVEYQDRNGAPQTIEAYGFLAVALQHEMDHLDGRVFIERLSLLKRKKFEKEWKRQNRKVS